MLSQTKPAQQSHRIRTTAAALCGVAGVLLALSSVLAVWLNQTITDAKTFSSTVEPLVTKPAIQNFVSQKITSQILDNVSTQELGAALLPTALPAGKTADQLTAQAQTYIQQNVQQIITSPGFRTLWGVTTTDLQKQLVSELGSSSNQLTIDLSPAINGVVQELKQGQPSVVADKIIVKPDAGKLQIAGKLITQLHWLFKLLQAATVEIVIVAILLLAASVAFAVCRSKTIRRILLTIGLAELVAFVVLEAPFWFKIGGGSIDSNAALAFIQVLIRNLQLATLVVGLVCILLAIISKLFDIWQRRATPNQRVGA